MCDSTDNWSCKFDESPEVMRSKSNMLSYQPAELKSGVPCGEETSLTLAGSSYVAEDDYKATELKIKSFLDEKVRPSLLHLSEKSDNTMHDSCFLRFICYCY